MVVAVVDLVMGLAIRFLRVAQLLAIITVTVLPHLSFPTAAKDGSLFVIIPVLNK